MIVNNTHAVRTTRLMRAVICGCAAVLLPLGFSLAADVEAVGKRLRTAVTEGELTAEQARHMLATLKKTESQQSADQVPTAERFESWVREAGEKVRSAVETGKATEKEAWARRATFMAALERCIEIVGEGVRRLPNELTQRRDDIPWKDIAGTRDHLIHGYDLIDHRVLWDAVYIDVPRLIEAIDELLG